MKYLLLFAAFIFSAVSFWVIKFVGRQSHLSLSMHVAKSKITSLAFGIFGAIATMAAAVAVLSYLLPRMDAHSLVYCIFVVVFFANFCDSASTAY